MGYSFHRFWYLDFFIILIVDLSLTIRGGLVPESVGTGTMVIGSWVSVLVPLVPSKIQYWYHALGTGTGTKIRFRY